MKKTEIQQRVLKNGKPLDLDKFEWDEKTRTFSSMEDDLVLDFYDLSEITFKTGSYCIFTTDSYCIFNTDSHCNFKTGSKCTFTTGSYCIFNTSSHCIFKTESNCAIIKRDIFEVIQPKKGETIQTCPLGIKGYLVDGKLNGEPHIIADSILSKIISKKGNIYKVINRGETEKTYLIEAENGDKKVYSHGKTLKEAQESLVYKMADRDKSAYKNLTMDSVLKKDEAIKAYMTITGACASGTKYFVDAQNEIKAEYSIKEVIEATKGQFGNREFGDFFEN